MEHRDSARHFADWLRHQLKRCGYDLDQRGEQARFIRDSGIPVGTMSRILAADTNRPDLKTLTALAEALHTPLGEVLVQAGVLSRDELPSAQTPHSTKQPMTPDEAADALGIDDPLDRELHRNMVETLRQRHRRGRENRRTGH